MSRIDIFEMLQMKFEDSHFVSEHEISQKMFSTAKFYLQPGVPAAYPDYSGLPIHDFIYTG